MSRATEGHATCLVEGVNLGSDGTMPGQGLDTPITTVLDTLVLLGMP
jgi:uncharacterized protein YceK